MVWGNLRQFILVVLRRISYLTVGLIEGNVSYPPAEGVSAALFLMLGAWFLAVMRRNLRRKNRARGEGRTCAPHTGDER